MLAPAARTTVAMTMKIAIFRLLKLIIVHYVRSGALLHLGLEWLKVVKTLIPSHVLCFTSDFVTLELG